MALEEAYSHYLKAKEFQVRPTAGAFNNLLSLASGLGEQGMGNGLCYLYLYI